MASETNVKNVASDELMRSLDSWVRIANKFEDISRSSDNINDEYFVNLVSESSDLASHIDVTNPEGEGRNDRLINHPESLEQIIYLPNGPEELMKAPARVDEAIRLVEITDNLYKKYAQKAPIIEHIHKKTEKLRELLISILCHSLDDLKDVEINELKSLINQLIRCGNFSDRDLRLRFLQARDGWFNNECEAKSESFDDLIMFFCEGLPKVFKEYKHLFADACTSTDRKKMIISTANNLDLQDGAIINSWLLLKTSTFILSLEVHLKGISQSKFITPTMIGDTMQKCFKLTERLSSTGFDFSAQLRPLFSQTIVEEVKYSVQQATTRFEVEFTRVVSKSIESLLLPVEDEILRISNMKPEEQVPKSICHYPVFKIYCLYIIDSLRWIQTTKNVLSPVGLCLDVYGVLNSSLTRVMQALAAVLNMDNNSSHPILSKIAIAFLTEVLPFMTDYCELLFPEKVVLSVIGMSKSEFKTISLQDPKLLKSFRLDLKQIAEPLRGTMPALMQVVEG